MAKLKVNDELINVIIEQTFLRIYPIGSIYISTNSTNPKDLFGGTWSQIKGEYLLGIDPDTTMEHKTPLLHIGGWDTEDTVLTVSQIPSHNHGKNPGVPNTYGFAVMTTEGSFLQTGAGGPKIKEMYNTGTTGGGKGHHHRYCPPSFTVYMWYRTA